LDREQERIYIKDQLENYLLGKGLPLNKNFSCLSPDHTDSKPSMSLDKKRNKVHCHSCGEDYDTIDLIGIEYSLSSDAEKFDKAREIFNIKVSGKMITTQKPVSTIKDKSFDAETSKIACTEIIAQAHREVCTTEYYANRGLSRAIVNEFKLGYSANYKCPYKDKKTGEMKNFSVGEAIIIPHGDDNYIARPISDKYKGEAKYLKLVGREQQIYNSQALYSNEPVFVVEGEFDALSVMEVGGQSIGLGSTSNINKLVNMLKRQKPNSTLLLSLDNDSAGQKAQNSLCNDLVDLNIKYKIVNISGEYNDPNEALVKNKESFLQVVITAIDEATAETMAEKNEEIVEYQKNNTASYLQSFTDGIHENANTPCIATGFSKLDSILDGGFYEGLYCVGAISSLGKTTMVLQIADQIAETGQDILIFSLEMARTELMSKSISRLTLELADSSRYAKSARGITAGKRYAKYSQTESELIKKSINKYGEYAKNIYIVEGMGDVGAMQIRQTVDRHVAITGNKPILIIDYLQLIAPHDPRATDKQATDKSVMELKRISRDYKIPVIAISSFNRASYKDAVSMESFKESGAIEYSSDVLMGLQVKGAGDKNFDVDEAKKKDPREIELKILKNRNGKTGDTIRFDYYPMFNYFKEV